MTIGENPSVLDSALQYAALGFRVIPVKSDKKPIFKEWTTLATLRPDIIRQWWLQFPNANVGICPDKDFCILDVDVKNGGLEKLQELEVEHGKLPDAVRSLTGGGGRHYYFRVDPSRRLYRKPFGDEVGIELVHFGHQAIEWPSLHASGNRYQWVKAINLAERHAWPWAPEWFYKPVAAASEPPKEEPRKPYYNGSTDRFQAYCLAALSKQRSQLAGVISGNRNEALNIAALKLGHLAHYGFFSEHEAREALKFSCELNGLIADDGIRSFEATFASGWKKGISEPKEIPDRPFEDNTRQKESIFSDNPKFDSETGEIYEDETPKSSALGFNIFDWTADKYAGQAPEIKWLIEDRIPLGIPMLLAAMGGVGKSYLALDLALSIAVGVGTGLVPKNCLGGTLMASGTAVVLSAEDSQESIHRRFNAIDPDGRRNINPQKLIVVPMPNAGGPRPMIGSNGRMMDKTPFFEDLKRQLCQIGDLRLLTIDPLQAFVAADVNSDPAAGQFMWSAFAEICALTGATVMVPHHMKKDDGSPINSIDEARSAIRGSSALVDGARLAYALWKVEEDRARAICRHTGEEYENGRVVSGAVVKVNDKADKSVTVYLRQKSGLLVAQNGEVSAVQKTDNDRLTDGQMRMVLSECQSRFLAGNPFSHSQLGGGFWLGRWLMGEFGLKRQAAKDIVDTLLSREILVVDMCDRVSKKRGLKVTKWRTEVPESDV